MPLSVLAAWWRAPRHRWRAVHYHAQRTEACLAMCSSLDLVGRSAELARVFGIELNAVLMRGSQYRVESMMIRMARTQNYLMLTPLKRDVEEQPAMDAQPLVMEPNSGFYTSPVVVLDFQSLYPSQIIAYNLCYSTCLGKVPGPAEAPAGGAQRKFGAAALRLPKGLLPAVEERVHITPNGARTHKRTRARQRRPSQRRRARLSNSSVRRPGGSHSTRPLTRRPPAPPVRPFRRDVPPPGPPRGPPPAPPLRDPRDARHGEAGAEEGPGPP